VAALSVWTGRRSLLQSHRNTSREALAHCIVRKPRRPHSNNNRNNITMKRTQNIKKEAASRNGTFSHLTDRAGFIDRAELNLRGVRKNRPNEDVTIDSNTAIGGPRRVYARAVHGVCPVTGNPWELRYGVLLPFKRVPPLRLVLRSEKTPLSLAQAELVSHSLIRRGFRSQLSKVEFTFDLTSTSVNFFIRHLETHARIRKVLCDQFGNQTYYVGGTRSPWQLRIYQKTDLIVRVEFIFRRPFLTAHNIQYPHQLVFLRRLDLSALFRLTEVDQAKLSQREHIADGDSSNRWLYSCARTLTPPEFSKMLRKQRIPQPGLFVSCELQKKLRNMQRRLIW
jgi:hypothetical protein